MKQITNRDLEALIRLINKATNSPMNTWESAEWQVGNFHLDCAMGGVSLGRVASKEGAISRPLIEGYVTKRALYDLLQAFLKGLTLKSEVE